jgi:tetratricopeptide (TPR) repeat protein
LGLIFVIPVVVNYWGVKRVVGIAVPVLLVFYMVSMERMMTLSHPILIWEDAEKLVDNRPQVPGASRIYYNHGIALFRNDDYSGAIAKYKKAIEIDPKHELAHGNLGMVYFKLSNWTDAIAEFDKAVALTIEKHKQPIPVYLLQRAQALEQTGDDKRAQKGFEELCKGSRIACDKLHRP